MDKDDAAHKWLIYYIPNEGMFTQEDYTTTKKARI